MQSIFRRVRERLLGTLRQDIAEQRQFTQRQFERINNFLENQTLLLNQQAAIVVKLHSEVALSRSLVDQLPGVLSLNARASEFDRQAIAAAQPEGQAVAGPGGDAALIEVFDRIWSELSAQRVKSGAVAAQLAIFDQSLSTLALQVAVIQRQTAGGGNGAVPGAESSRLSGLAELQAGTIDGLNALVQELKAQVEPIGLLANAGQIETIAARLATLQGYVANVENALANIAIVISAAKPVDPALAPRQMLAVAAMAERVRSPLAERGQGRLARAYKPAEPESLEAYLAKLEALEPRAFPIWTKLFQQGAESYSHDPSDSCSVWGNTYAEAFRDFCSLHLRGRVLDIGIGPFGKPLYLSGYPSGLISAVEPLAMKEPTDFEVVRGFAEFLPWPDGAFDTVIAATSLDHALSLEKALSEADRVLAPGGAFLIWIGSVPGAAKYDPRAAEIAAIDQFHLFHIDAAWFEPMMRKMFRLEDRLAFPAGSFDHVFYRFEKKIPPATAA